MRLVLEIDLVLNTKGHKNAKSYGLARTLTYYDQIWEIELLDSHNA